MLPRTPLFSDPHLLIQSAGIQPGNIVVDFGSGSGRFVIEAARALAATGKVYAVDVQPDLAVRTAALAREAHLSNVDVIVGDVEKSQGSQLADGCADLVIMSNILFQLTDKKITLAEARRILKPGARVLAVDWQDSFGGIGPAPQQIISREMARDLFEKNGFATEREVDAGSHHYGYIFKKF